MKIYNSIDEKGRMTKLPKFYFDGNGQYDSHTISYLCARNIIKNSNKDELMGLEKITEDLEE